MQFDGNFVLYVTMDWKPKNALWSSKTYNKGVPPRRVVMQDDGNLVLYAGNNKATWATGTNK
jgi:hypothetical protein